MKPSTCLNLTNAILKLFVGLNQSFNGILF
jgi:hypothetical protein